MSDVIDPARFAPPLSFMGVCYGHDLAGAAAAIVGLPFDVGIDSHCAGAHGRAPGVPVLGRARQARRARQSRRLTGAPAPRADAAEVFRCRRRRPVLEFYFRITRRLYPWRSIFWLLMLASIVAFGATVLTSRGGDDSAWLVPAVAVLLWSLSLLLIVYTFIHPLPVIEADDGWFARVGKRLARLAYWLLAWTMTLACLFALHVTFKAVMIVVGA